MPRKKQESKPVKTPLEEYYLAEKEYDRWVQGHRCSPSSEQARKLSKDIVAKARVAIRSLDTNASKL